MQAGGSAAVQTDGGIAQRQRLRQKQRQKKRLDGSGPILKPFLRSADGQVSRPELLSFPEDTSIIMEIKPPDGTSMQIFPVKTVQPGSVEYRSPPTTKPPRHGRLPMSANSSTGNGEGQPGSLASSQSSAADHGQGSSDGKWRPPPDMSSEPRSQESPRKLLWSISPEDLRTLSNVRVPPPIIALVIGTIVQATLLDHPGTPQDDQEIPQPALWSVCREQLRTKYSKFLIQMRELHLDSQDLPTWRRKQLIQLVENPRISNPGSPFMRPLMQEHGTYRSVLIIWRWLKVLVAQYKSQARASIRDQADAKSEVRLQIQAPRETEPSSSPRQRDARIPVLKIGWAGSLSNRRASEDIQSPSGSEASGEFDSEDASGSEDEFEDDSDDSTEDAGQSEKFELELQGLDRLVDVVTARSARGTNSTSGGAEETETGFTPRSFFKHTTPVVTPRSFFR